MTQMGNMFFPLSSRSETRGCYSRSGKFHNVKKMLDLLAIDESEALQQLNLCWISEKTIINKVLQCFKTRSAK